MDLEKRECYSRFHTIPDVILEDVILTRLYDIRTVIQCTSVCKRWYSVISAFRRANKHRTSKCFTLLFQWHVDATVNPDFPVLIASDGSKNRDSSNKNTDHSISFFDFMGPLKPTDVVASCSDLLLLLNCTTDSTYHVVNPLLCQWIPLPRAPRLSFPAIRFGMSFKPGFLWDYVKNSNSQNNLVFKVIRICCVRRQAPDYGAVHASLLGLDNNEFRVQMFSSDTNTWTEYMVDWYPFKLTHYLYELPIISHNRMFHWLNGNSLVSLDPFNLKLNDSGVLQLSRVIKLPERNTYDSKYMLKGLGVSGGHLRIIDNRNPDFYLSPTTIWQLDETKIGRPNASELGMWSIVHKFRIDKMWQFLAFHPYEGDVVFVRREYDALKINIRDDGVEEKFKEHKPRCWLRDEERPPLPPLVHPWYPTVLNPLVN